MTCVIDDCAEVGTRRGLCVPHYNSAYKRGEHKLYPATVHLEADGWVNPLVCVCETPDADPARDFGECSICRRKPLALMAAQS